MLASGSPGRLGVVLPLFVVTILCSAAADGQSQTSGYSHSVTPEGTSCSGQFICEEFTATASGWTFNGNASQKLTEGVVELTPAQNWQRGSAFHNTPATIDSFAATFTMRLDSTGGPVADGLTFAVVEAGPATLGDSGGYLAYRGIPGRSFAVEFDTYFRTSDNYWDPPVLHVGLDVNGSVASSATAALGPIVDQALLTVRVVASAGTIDVYLQGGSAYPAEVKVLTATIPNWTPFVGYFGFTAATGMYNERHVIDSLTVDLVPTIAAPIIFVHGWCGAASDWDRLVDALQAGYPGRYGATGDRATLSYDYSQGKVLQDPDDGPHPIYLLSLRPSCQGYSCGSPPDDVDLANTSIREKAFQLKKAIDHVKGDGQVIVVGHSQGGLVGRAYVQGLACEGRGNLGDQCTASQQAPYGGDVTEVVTVDTPNAGSVWAAVSPWFFWGCRLEDTFSKQEMTRFPLSPSLGVLNARDMKGLRVTSVTSYTSGMPLTDGVVDYDSQSLKSGLFDRYMDARNISNIDNPLSADRNETIHTAVLGRSETAVLLDSIIQSRLPKLEVTDFVTTPIPPPSLGLFRGVDAGFVTASFKVNVLGAVSERVEFRYSPPGRAAAFTNRSCSGCYFEPGGATSKPYQIQGLSAKHAASLRVLLDETVGALVIDSRGGPTLNDGLPPGLRGRQIEGLGEEGPGPETPSLEVPEGEGADDPAAVDGTCQSV